MGLEQGSYVAYCFDEAVIYFGMTVDSELQEAGQKQSKEDRRAQMARERYLDRVLNDGNEKSATKGFADPAAMFG